MTDIDDTAYTGNDELTEDARIAVDARQAAMTTDLERIVQASEGAKEWLRQPLGKEFKLMIAENKLDAMTRAATATAPEAVKEAQFDYAVWSRIETVIGTVIVGGPEALKHLEVIRTESNDV
jgi:hypothetical protein